MKKLINKFCNKNKVSVSFNHNDLIKLYINQNKKCHITKHEMTHLVDSKGRIDNIFNISIMPIDFKKEIIPLEDIKLVINLFYSVGLKYNLGSDNIKSIYKDLTCTKCDLC